MSDYRSAIEREMQRVQPRPYSFDVFQDRRLRAARRRRAGASVLGLLLGAMVVLSMLYALRGREDVTPAIRPIMPGTVSDLGVFWSRAAGTSINSTPVVAGDRVYITNTAGTLIAFPTTCPSAPGTCKPIWTANEGRGSSFDIGSPAVGGGMVFAASAQGELIGYPTSCGPGSCRPTWRATPGGDLSTASPVVADGVVYVGSTDGILSAYDVACGSYARPCRPSWTASLEGGFGARGYAGAQPVVADGIVYIGSTDGTLYSFSTSCTGTCRPLRQVSLPGVLSNPLVLVDGTLYVTSGHELYAFPTRCLARGASCGPDWIGRASALILSPPAVGNEHVYVGSTDGVVSVFPQACARHGRRCRPAWSISNLGRFPNPSLVDGVLFVGITWGPNELEAYDADCGASGATCSPLWSYVITAFGSVQQQTTTDGSGTLFAVVGDQGGGGEGQLYAFRVGAAASASAQFGPQGGAPSIDIVTVTILGMIAASLAVLWRRGRRRGRVR